MLVNLIVAIRLRERSFDYAQDDIWARLCFERKILRLRSGWHMGKAMLWEKDPSTTLRMTRGCAQD